MSLSQSKTMSSRHNGVMGGGRKLFGQVHVPKVSHHGAIPVAWSRAMHMLKRQLTFLPDLKVVCHYQTFAQPQMSIQEYKFDYVIFPAASLIGERNVDAHAFVLALVFQPKQSQTSAQKNSQPVQFF